AGMEPDAPAARPEPRIGAGIDFSDPHSPLAPFYLRTPHVVAVAAVLAVFVFGTRVPLWHTDVWGHVKYGEWMVQNRAIPDRAPGCSGCSSSTCRTSPSSARRCTANSSSRCYSSR